MSDWMLNRIDDVLWQRDSSADAPRQSVTDKGLTLKTSALGSQLRSPNYLIPFCLNSCREYRNRFFSFFFFNKSVIASE